MSPGPPSTRVAQRSIQQLVLALVLALGSRAHAQEPAVAASSSSEAAADVTCTGRYVVLRAASDVPPELAREVRTDLSTELGRRGLSVCDDGASESAPAAVVHLSLREKEASIELDDRTTQKRVARDVRLDRVPPAGRALALAIAIDELLRASWAELTMREREAPPAEAPSEPELPRVAREVEERPDTPTRSRVRVRGARFGAGLAFVHSWQRFDALALTFHGRAMVGRRGHLSLDVGPLAALPVDTSLGSVSTYGASSSLGGGACVPLVAPLSLCLGARAGVDFLYFRGDAASSARASRGEGWLVRGEGRAGLSVALGARVHLGADVGLGQALHGVRASDGARTLVGADGVMLSSQLTLGVQR